MNGLPRPLLHRAGLTRRALRLARRSFHHQVAHSPEPLPTLAGRRARLPDAQTRTGQRLLPAHGSTLRPRVHDSHDQSRYPDWYECSRTSRSSMRCSTVCSITAPRFASTVHRCAIPTPLPRLSPNHPHPPKRQSTPPSSGRRTDSFGHSSNNRRSSWRLQPGHRVHKLTTLAHSLGPFLLSTPGSGFVSGEGRSPIIEIGKSHHRGGSPTPKRRPREHHSR